MERDSEGEYVNRLIQTCHFKNGYKYLVPYDRTDYSID